jgi:hypothetical protein
MSAMLPALQTPYTYKGFDPVRVAEGMAGGEA